MPAGEATAALLLGACTQAGREGGEGGRESQVHEREGGREGVRVRGCEGVRV